MVAGGPLRILVIDDELSFARAVAREWHVWMPTASNRELTCDTAEFTVLWVSLP